MNRLVLIKGEVGIGKTRLGEELSSRALRRGLVVARELDATAIARAGVALDETRRAGAGLGAAELALELMIRRAHDRVAFGTPLIDKGSIRQDVAWSRIELESTSPSGTVFCITLPSRGPRQANGRVAGGAGNDAGS